MSGQWTSSANYDTLVKYLWQPVHSDEQVDIVCKLLSTVYLPEITKFDGLRLVRLYLDNCCIPNIAILKQFAVGGFYSLQDEQSRTPLHWILEESHMRSRFGSGTIISIISHGGNPSLTDEHGNNALHLAVSVHVGIDAVIAILEGQPKPSPLVTARNKKGWTPIGTLASGIQFFHQVTTLKHLIDFGGDINEKDESGNSLLHIVFSPSNQGLCQNWSGAQELARAFSVLGADVNAKNNLNHVPLRVVIDLERIGLNDMILMIPSVDILNDDSCWDGPFIDCVFKNPDRLECAKFLDVAFEAGATRTSEKTLMMAMRCRDVQPKHIAYLIQIARTVKFVELEEALRQIRFDLLEPILVNADDEMLENVKVRHPNILVKISEHCLQNYATHKVPLANLITILVNKFAVDVNYKDIDDRRESLLLHNLVPCMRSDSKECLDLVLSFNHLNIDQTIKMEKTDVRSISALELAIQNRNYKVAEKLIENFASVTNLGTISLSAHSYGFAHCFQLLSVLGHKFDFENLLKTPFVHNDPRQELKYVKNWISKRANTVLSLKELSALQVRRHVSNRGAKQWMTENIPEVLHDPILLKPYVDNFEFEDSFYSSSESGDSSSEYEDDEFPIHFE